MKLQISEIFSKLKDFKGDGSVNQKVEWLRQNDSPTLRLLLQHAFDGNVKYNLPEGDPPFKRNEAPLGMGDTTLYAETRRLGYLWVTQSDDALESLTNTQREQLTRAEAIQQEHGEKVKTATEEVRRLERELKEVQETIEAAKARYRQIMEEGSAAVKVANAAKAAADDIDRKVAALKENMLRSNAELSGRQIPQSQPSMPKYRLEMSFIELLESLQQDEADVLLAVKNKSLAKKYALNKDIVKKAFPNLIA